MEFGCYNSTKSLRDCSEASGLLRRIRADRPSDRHTDVILRERGAETRLTPMVGATEGSCIGMSEGAETG